MNRAMAFFILFLIMGCAADSHQANTTNEAKNNTPKIADAAFDIGLQIDEVDDEQYNLAVTIELDEGGYVVSPYSEDDTYGHFNISIADTPHLISGDTLLEIPSSVAEFDPILNRPVRFVRNNTTYKQKIRVISQDDFDVSGLIWFVLEPSCVPYEVVFTISHRSGEMKVNKTKTSIAKGYKHNKT